MLRPGLECFVQTVRPERTSPDGGRRRLRLDAHTGEDRPGSSSPAASSRDHAPDECGHRQAPFPDEYGQSGRLLRSGLVRRAVARPSPTCRRRNRSARSRRRVGRRAGRIGIRLINDPQRSTAAAPGLRGHRPGRAPVLPGPTATPRHGPASAAQ